MFAMTIKYSESGARKASDFFVTIGGLKPLNEAGIDTVVLIRFFEGSIVINRE